MIISNILINIHYSFLYNLRIGLISTYNYFLFQSIISKPWTKLANVAFAIILADIYMQILKYRSIQGSSKKASELVDQYYLRNQFPLIHKWHTDSRFAYLFQGLGGVLVVVNLVFPTHWNAEGDGGSKMGNGLYYGISRVAFVFSVFLIFLAVFTQRVNMGRAALSGGNLRLIAKAMPIMCLIQILIIQILYSSNAAPDGLYITGPMGAAFCYGLLLVTSVTGVLLLVFIEFPCTRMLQYLFLPYLSHDSLLRNHYDAEQQLRTGAAGAPPRMAAEGADQQRQRPPASSEYSAGSGAGRDRSSSCSYAESESSEGKEDREWLGHKTSINM